MTRTSGLRAMVAVSAVVLGWAVTRELLMPAYVGEGPIGLGPVTFVRELAGAFRATLFLGVALAALLCLARVMVRRTGILFEDQRAWHVSLPWLGAGLTLTVLLPVPAMACVAVAASLGALLNQKEGSPIDLPAAVGAHAAALLLGVAVAQGVTHPGSLLATGYPQWSQWAAWDVPRDVLGAPFLLATGFVLCARVSYLLPDEGATGRVAGQGTGALRIAAFAGCFGVLVFAFWLLMGSAEYVYGWAQPNYAQMGGACCLFALIRMLAAWNPRRLTLEPRATLAAGVLLHAGLAYGLGQSVPALFVLGIGFAFFGRPAKGPARRTPSRLAGRIRPSAWPWVR